MAEIVGAIFIGAGALIIVLSSIGIIRFPDIYNRNHAASKSSTLGVLCVLMGAFFYFWISVGYISIRLLLGIFFVFLTAPVAAHLLCRSAYRTGVPLSDKGKRDDLKSYLKKEKEVPN